MPISKPLITYSATSVLFLMAILLPAHGDDEAATNPIVHLSERDGDVRWMTDISRPLTIFRTREARQVIATLSANQKLTILEMDRFGFHVRGESKNGHASGWTGWKSLLGNAPEKHAAVEKFRQRQFKVLQLIEAKRPAVGMTFEELKLALGAPTRSDVSISKGKRVRSAIWTKKKTIDAKDILGPLSILTDERELKIDTGSIVAEIVDGVVTAVQIDLEGDDTDGAELVKPVQIPFSRVVFESHEAMADGR